MPFSGKQNTNLYEFRNIVGDGARSYLFEIEIPFLDASNSTDDAHTLTCLAKSTILPRYTIEDIPFEFQKSTFHMGGRAKFETWNITFVADAYHKLRHRLLAWQSVIFDPTRQVGYSPSSYKKDGVTVRQLDRMGNIVTAYVFKGIYPSEVGEIQLDQSSTNIEEFNVTFTYDYYVIEGDKADSKVSSYTQASDLNVGDGVLSLINAAKTNSSQDVTDIDVNGVHGATQPAANTDPNAIGGSSLSNKFGSKGPIGYNPAPQNPSSKPSEPTKDISQTQKDLSGMSATLPAAQGFFEAIGNSIGASKQPFGDGKINTPDSSNAETTLGNVFSFNPYNALGVPYSYRWMPPVKGLASIKLSRNGIG